MKQLTHEYHMRLNKVPETIDVNLQFHGKRRSKCGPLTISAFDLLINGQTIVSWQTAAHSKKFTRALP